MESISMESTRSQADRTLFRLLDLPLELRLRIYEQLFRSSHPHQYLVIYEGKIRDEKFRGALVNPIPLLRTCRVIYEELRPALFRKYHHTITFGNSMCDCEYHASQLYKACDYTGFHLLRYVSIDVSSMYPTDGTAADLVAFVKATNFGQDITRLRLQFQVFPGISQARFDLAVSIACQMRPRKPILASISSGDPHTGALDLGHYRRTLAAAGGIDIDERKEEIPDCYIQASPVGSL